MEHLWTPWRSTYMKSQKRAGECIFCVAAANPADDAENFVVYRGLKCFVILNLYPYTSGHMMIVPYQHVSKLIEADEESAAEMIALARRAETVLEEIYTPDGLNMGLNVGSAAGAGIAQHIHMHVLPRWSGDANFMTTVGSTRIIPEAVDETYQKVKFAWRT